MGSSPQIYKCELAFSGWFLTGPINRLQTVGIIPSWKWNLLWVVFAGGGGDRKKVPVQRTLALISAAWICTRETKAVGQPSPSYIVGKQKLSGQHTAELLALLSRLTSSKKKKNQSWQTRNKLEWNMDEPPKHPSIEAQLFGLGCANSVEHTGRHKAFFMVWCLKDWFLLGPKRHWSRRLCHWTISFQDETLQNEAVPPLLGPVSQNAALTQGWGSCGSLCCYQTLFGLLAAFLSHRSWLVYSPSYALWYDK